MEIVEVVRRWQAGVSLWAIARPTGLVPETVNAVQRAMQRA